MPRYTVLLVAALMALLAPAAAYAAAPVNSTPPSISGVAHEGQVLTADDGTWTGATGTSRRWQRCDVTATDCVNLPATGASYTVVAADVGSVLRLVVTASNASGSATATSAPTAVVTGTAPTNTVAPVVSGNLRQGQVLTAGTGTWTGTVPMTYAYEWRSCDTTGSACAPIAGATASTYTLTAGDVGTTIRVRVTATNAAGSDFATSAQTGTIGPPSPPVNTVLPTISGTPRDASSLSSTTGTWTGATTITYTRRWQRCDALGSSCLDTTATTPTYAVGAADIGYTIRLVVTATNPDGTATATSAVTAVVTANPPSNTAVPRISGNNRDGQTLTATLGTWSGTAPLTYAAEWWRCDATGNSCAAISGQTASTYVLTLADEGHTIRYAVTGTNAAGSATGVANPTAVIGPPQPPVNTALPAVSGTLQDGQTLSSTTGTWTGAATITYARQWQRCDSLGAACADTGLTTPTYRLSSADVGSTVRLVVTATNPDGTATATSAVTGVVAPLAPAGTAAPAISGTAKDLQTLTATNGTWNGTTPLSYALQWQRCNSAGASCSPVAGATGSTYVLSGADIGLTIRVTVTATNSAGSATATSGATAVIAAAPPANTVAPAISGTARDSQTLTVSPGTWTGTTPIAYSYQWRRCNSAGSSCTNVTGATSSTYALAPADVGFAMRVTVTATNGAGTAVASTPLTLPVAPDPPVNTAAPALSGAGVDGTTLTVSPGTWTGTPTLALSYRWERCDPLATCTVITGATSASYKLTSADVGFDVRVAVTALNAAGSATAYSAGTGIVAPLAPSNTVLPVVTGTGRDGQTLSATPGTWTGTTPLTLAYQWRRCDSAGANCTDVAGATGTTYQLTGTDVGFTVRVAVTATNAGGTTTAVSALGPVVAWLPPSLAATPIVSGLARDGRTLTVDGGDWSGTAPFELAYQWRRCDTTGAHCTDITGAVDSSYVLTTADVGFTLRVLVTATNGGGTASTLTAATGVAQPNPPVNLTAPAILGTVRDGQMLTVDDGTWTGLVTIGFDHRWWRCDANGNNCGVIPGATGSSYVVSGTDVGYTLKVEVIATNGGGATSAFSPATTVGQPAPPDNVTLPVVGGHHGVGQQLTADPGTWTGSPPLALAYQWQLCDAAGANCTDLPGENASAITLTNAELGDTLRVVVTASNGAGSATAVSAVSPAVRNDPPVSVTLPAVTGTPVAQNVALTAGKGTWSGATPMIASYQWRRCDALGAGCLDIAGATGPTYVPQAADVGGALRVAVTMDNGVGTGTATSGPSTVVQPAPPSLSIPPTATANGTTPGASVTGTTGSWTGYKPITYATQWLRCNAAGAACVPIQDATGTKYALTGDDIGHLLRLQVTATNATGPTVARTAPVGPVTAIPPGTSGRPRITVSGLPHVGSVLDADPGTWSGTLPLLYRYQWQRCVGATDCRDIPGATKPEYVATTDDLGRGLLIEVTAANSAGHASAQSPPTSAIVGLPPASDHRPSIHGTLRDGHTLTAKAGTWTGTGPIDLAYAWERCTASVCTPVAGATDRTYRLSADDVGQRIAVRVTATNAEGKADAESIASAVVDGATPHNRHLPTVSRLPTVPDPGTVLTGRPGTWGGTAPVTFTYNWLRCDARGRRCHVIPKATALTYTLTRADLRGSRLRGTLRLAVTASNAAGDKTALSAPLGLVPQKPLPRLSFIGAVLSGRVLTLAVSCAHARCRGAVTVLGHSRRVDLARRKVGALVVRLGRAVKVGAGVAVRYTPTGRGRAVARTVPVTRH